MKYENQCEEDPGVFYTETWYGRRTPIPPGTCKSRVQKAFQEAKHYCLANPGTFIYPGQDEDFHFEVRRSKEEVISPSSNSIKPVHTERAALRVWWFDYGMGSEINYPPDPNDSHYVPDYSKEELMLFRRLFNVTDKQAEAAIKKNQS